MPRTVASSCTPIITICSFCLTQNTLLLTFHKRFYEKSCAGLCDSVPTHSRASTFRVRAISGLMSSVDGPLRASSVVWFQFLHSIILLPPILPGPLSPTLPILNACFPPIVPVIYTLTLMVCTAIHTVLFGLPTMVPTCSYGSVLSITQDRGGIELLRLRWTSLIKAHFIWSTLRKNIATFFSSCMLCLSTIGVGKVTPVPKVLPSMELQQMTFFSFITSKCPL